MLPSACFLIYLIHKFEEKMYICMRMVRDTILLV